MLQGEGYEAGEDSGSETETGDEKGSEDDFDAPASDDGFDGDALVGCGLAAVHDDIPLKRFHNRGFASDFDDSHRGADDTTFLDDEVEVLELDEDGFNKIPGAEGGSTCVETGETADANEATNLANEDASGKGLGAETGQFQSGEASDAVEATNLVNEDASPTLVTAGVQNMK